MAETSKSWIKCKSMCLSINPLILIWFTGLIEKAVTWIIKAPANKEEDVFRLKYIEAGPVATPELAIEQTFNEIIHFAQISRNGLGYVRSAINETDPDRFEELRRKLVKYEVSQALYKLQR